MADAFAKEDGTQEKLRRFLAQGEWKYQEDKDVVAEKSYQKKTW